MCIFKLNIHLNCFPKKRMYISSVHILYTLCILYILLI